MVKELYLANSTDELNTKASDVIIGEKTDSAKLVRYVRSASTVYVSAESKFTQGDEELAYVYYMKYFHVYTQLRSTLAYINSDKVVTKEMNKSLPISKCHKALGMAEKLKKSLERRYRKREAAQEKVRRKEEEVKRVEEEREKELLELERLKIEAAQPSIDAATLFSLTNNTFTTPLVPLGQSPKDIIPKEPYISAIELMHIIEAKITVLLVDIRSLDEFKDTHVIHEAVIFISKDYLDINTRLTANEIRDLILIKDHKLLWDKRASYDVIVLFDTSSHYQSIADLPTHHINLVRECASDCLDPNFMNTDLPKVLDGGYDTWVYHFPKHCTNPDKANKRKPAVRKSLPTLRPSLLLSSDIKSTPIYPELNNDTEPKLLPLIPAPLSLGDAGPSLYGPVAPHSAPVSPLATHPPSLSHTSQSVVTCGNVQINVQQVPQTIQINQWNQEHPGIAPPALTAQPSTENPYRMRQAEQQPPLFAQRNSDQAPSRASLPAKPSRGSLKITDVVYEGAPQARVAAAAASVPHSTVLDMSRAEQAEVKVPQPTAITQDIPTTFPPKRCTPDPIYAQIEPRKRPIAPVSAVPSNPEVTEYADIRSIRPSADTASPPNVDRSKKPSAPDVRPPPPPAQPSQQPVPQQPVPQQPREQPTPRPQQPRPQQTTPTQPTARSPTPNPTVNRVVKPLSAKAIEEKYLRMMPAHGAVQLGTCGLKNIGNTCFMNAVLQCLAATAPLTHYFVGDAYKSEINPDNPLGTQGLVAEEYAFLIRAMWSGRFRHIAPKDWKTAIGRFRPQFLDYSQKDSQEFTSFMLDALHEDLNRVTVRRKTEEVECSNIPYQEGARRSWDSYKQTNDSIIVDLFQGQFRSVMLCMACGHEAVKFETFMYLTVPVGKSKSSLKTCIDNFCQAEQIEWTCSKCKRFGDATKHLTIWKLPHILVVILKRFSFSGVWRDKITTYVDFPVSNFRVTPNEVDWLSNPKEGRNYRLFGVTNHTGTLDGGHYIGCARNPVSGDWFTYDDHVIRPMKADQTKKKDAYLLFYSSLSEQQDLDWIRKRS